MKKTQRVTERDESEGRVTDTIKWEFPISEAEPKNLTITLVHSCKTNSHNKVYVEIEGLMRPNAALSASGPLYVGRHTKDPILYQLAVDLLDAFDAETHRSVTFSPEVQQKIKEQAVITKNPNNSVDGAHFTLSTYSFDKPPNFSPKEADTLFSNLERLIDGRASKIALKVAACAEARPALIAKEFAIDDPTMQEEYARVKFAQVAGLTTKQYDAFVDRARRESGENGDDMLPRN